MKNTLENKQKFFAQYWGQVIQLFRGHLYNMVDPENEGPLELIPLSSISDEDAKSIGFPNAEEFLEHLEFYNYQLDNALRHDQIDILRSRSIAVPFMGISVETLVEWGWVKLKEVNNG